MNHLRRNSRRSLDEAPINDPHYSINHDGGGAGGMDGVPGGGASEFEDHVPLIEGKEWTTPHWTKSNHRNMLASRWTSA